jgi:hypothetical protein
MSNLNKLNGWAGDGGYISLTSAQSYMASVTDNRSSSGCGSSCSSKDDDVKPKPSSCGTGDSEPKPSSCGASESDSKPKTSACGSSCGSGGE